MSELWQTWKKGFDAWESATAEYLEQWLRSSTVLQPAGFALTAFTRFKAAHERAVAEWWAAMGLPTRREQERSLHTLNQLESRLIDLEDKLAELEDDRNRPSDGG